MENKYTNPIIEVKNLKKYFPITSGFFKKTVGYVKAVDNIDMYINEGETLALVGESGCGKTTTGRTIINLYDPTEGDVYFQGLRISSTQNGLPVLIRQMKNEADGKIKELATALKEQCAAHPEKKD